MATVHTFARRMLVLLVVSLSCTALARAEDAKVDAESQKAIDAFGAFYQKLKGFEVSIKIDLAIEQQGRKQSQDFSQKLSVERPNKFASQLTSKTNGASVVSDGSDLSIYFQGLEKYAVEKAPDTFEGLFQNPVVLGSLGMGNALPVTMALLSDDPAKQLVKNVTAIEYGGLVDLGDAKCHLLKAVTNEVDWQLWIDAGKQPLVRQFVPDLVKAFEKMAKGQKGKSQFEGLKVTNTVTYKDWQFDPKFAADAFAFKAPEKATKVDTAMEIITGRKPAEPEPHALLGKAAPPVELELLGGGKLDLASLKEKNIVILDFWATWCGPCVKAMPIIEKVAEKYKDKGVLLYAVNLEEKPDEIQAFLDEAKLKVSVALDSNGEVAKAYAAAAIPQTVLIGKDGSVQVVKVGLSLNLEEALEKDIEGLLAGKNLAEGTLAAFKAKQEAKQSEGEKPAAKE